MHAISLTEIAETKMCVMLMDDIAWLFVTTGKSRREGPL
jgi:hypothetical protein